MLQRTPELLAKYPHRWIDGSGVVVRTSREINFTEHAAIVKEFRTHGSHIGEFGPGKINDLTYCVYDVDVIDFPEKDTTPELTQEQKLLEFAWGVIANAHEGNWDSATSEWRDAAKKWRDEWFDTLKNPGEDQTTPEDNKYRFKYERNGLMIHSDVTLWTWGFEQIEREYGRRGSHEGLIDISAPMINYRVYSVKNVSKPVFDSLGSALTEFGEEFQAAGDKFLDALRKAFPNG